MNPQLFLVIWLRSKRCCWLETLMKIMKMCGVDFFLVNSLLSCVSFNPPPPHSLSSHSLNHHGPWCSAPLPDQSFPASGGVTGSLSLSLKSSHYTSLTVCEHVDSMKVCTLIRFLSTSNGFSLYTQRVWLCGFKPAQLVFQLLISRGCHL